MKPKIVLTIAGVIYAIRGVMLLLAPGKLYGAYGATLDALGTWNAHFISGLCLAIAVLNLFSARETSTTAVRTVFLANIVLQVCSIAWSVNGMMSGLFNSLAWAAIIVDAVLLVLFAAFYFAKPAAQQG